MSPYSSLLLFSLPLSYPYCILNNIHYIISILSLLLVWTVHSFSPFPKISPLYNCLAHSIPTKFIPTCLCECSKLNPPAVLNTLSRQTDGHTWEKILPTACGRRWEGLSLSASRYERLYMHTHTNTCISRWVPADRSSPVLSVSWQRSYSRIVALSVLVGSCDWGDSNAGSWLWLYLCNLRIWLYYSSRNHVVTLLDSHPFDVTKKYI